MVPPFIPGPRGRSKGWGDGFRKYYTNTASLGSEYGTGMYFPHVGFSVLPQALVHLRLRHHFVYGVVKMLAHSWTQLRLSLMVWNGVEYRVGLNVFVAEQQTFRKVRGA